MLTLGHGDGRDAAGLAGRAVAEASDENHATLDAVVVGGVLVPVAGDVIAYAPRRPAGCNRNTTFLTWNLLHLARVLKAVGGIPAHGNQVALWNAGCRFDYEHPEHRARRPDPPWADLGHVSLVHWLQPCSILVLAGV